MIPVDLIIPFASEVTERDHPLFAFYNRPDVRHTPDAIRLNREGAHGLWMDLRNRLLPLLPHHGRGVRIIAWQYGGWRLAIGESEACIDALNRARIAGMQCYSKANTTNFAVQVYADTGLWPAWYMGYAYPPECPTYASILARRASYSLFARLLGYSGDPREAAWHHQMTLDTRELSALGPIYLDSTIGVHPESFPDAPWAWWSATWARREYDAGRVGMVETAHREGVTLLYPVPMMVTEEQMHLIDNGGDDSVRRDLPDTLITVRMKGDDPKRAKDHLTRGRRVAIAPWGLIERGQSLADWAREAGASA